MIPSYFECHIRIYYYTMLRAMWKIGQSVGTSSGQCKTKFKNNELYSIENIITINYYALPCWCIYDIHQYYLQSV